MFINKLKLWSGNDHRDAGDLCCSAWRLLCHCALCRACVWVYHSCAFGNLLYSYHGIIVASRHSLVTFTMLQIVPFEVTLSHFYISRHASIVKLIWWQIRQQTSAELNFASFDLATLMSVSEVVFKVEVSHSLIVTINLDKVT